MRETRHSKLVATALCAAAMMGIGACTNADSAGKESTEGTAAATAGDSTGVTADTIRIGWPTLDQETLVQAGLATDFGDIDTLAQKMVADWNAADGINGRRVELVKRTFGTDIANLLPDMQRLCLELTEDEKVFATAAIAWFGDAVTCLAGDHDTPLLDQSSLSQSVLETGNGNIFLANLMWEDALRSAVRVVDETGELDSFEKIGVFGPLEPGMRDAIDNGLAPALKEAGAGPAVDGTIPFAVPADNAAIAAVVSRFKSEKVDAVFATGNFYFNGAFMTEAERQSYRPTYVMSDLSEGTDDLILKFAPASQLANAIGASWKGKPPEPLPSAEAKACVAKYAPTAGASVTKQIGAAQTCELMNLLRRGLEGAGDAPTRESFIKAMEGLDDVTTSGGGKGGFTADDHTLPDQVRLVRFDLKGCKCWASDGDWINVNG